MNEAELRRQIGYLSEMGMGGGFMHSRVGLGTRYLSPEWFRMISACSDECRKRGMEAWLYDEDRWPSGAAGGLVTKDRRYSMRSLECSVTEAADFKQGEGELAAFAVQMIGGSPGSARRLSQGEKADKGGKIMVFRVRVSDPSPWYNGETYLDTLSSEAVRKFVETTHDAYARENAGDLGKTIPGIFTDEPNYGSEGSGRIPWTDSLPGVFRSRYGYDILDHLPELYYVLGRAVFSKARRDYRDCLTHLFVRGFSEQIGRWCQENGLLFTGHVLSEESLLDQTKVVGSAMRFYEFMQAPGIDVLKGQGLERKGGEKPEYLTAKQCASVLRQFGRKWMLSELYGCTGWQFTFEEYKAVGDWQAALGVNLRCPHLSWYTMEGEAKRDYPASIFLHSPWWRDYRIVEDYFSRLNVLLTQGEAVRDVAVIHPIESAWGIHVPSGQKAVALLDKRLDSLQQALLEEHFDFDYVDEEMLSRHGSVAKGEFRMAKAAYRAVVVPPMVTIRRSTLALLEGFSAQGGSVIFVEPIPTRMDGELSPEPGKLAERTVRIRLEKRKLSDALNRIEGLRRVSITGSGGEQYPHSLYMLRHDADSDRWVVFMCNTGQKRESGPLKVGIPAVGQVQEWDPATGLISLADSHTDGKHTIVETFLPGAGSRLFVVCAPGEDKFYAPPKLKKVKRIRIRGWSFEYKLSEDNAFPLDMPEYSVDGGAFMPAQEVLQVDRAVRDAIHIPHRGGAMVQPWAAPTGSSDKGVPVRLRYRFNVEEPPSEDIALALENPASCTVEINGVKIETAGDHGWWIDPCLKLVSVGVKCLRRGPNEILLSREYGPKSGLECMFLVGRFGVLGSGRKFSISSMPRTLRRGDWRKQGLPFYSGSVTYEMAFRAEPKPGSRVSIAFPGWKGTLLKIRVNGRAAGPVAWKPWETDISDSVTAGLNRVEVEIVSSRRNLLGPLHCREVYPKWTGPWEFVDMERYTADYVGVPYGLSRNPVVTIREPA